MLAIAGLITREPREWAESHLLRMIEPLRHEPSFVTGTWFEKSVGVYLGWAARPGAFLATIPIQNERRDIVLAFSGEEFPEPGARGRLKERGHAVDSEGLSYLVHMYEEDPSFPAGLNGWFHGLLVDRARGTATLF